MYSILKVCTAIALLALVGCSTSSNPGGGNAVFGEYEVKWSALHGMSAGATQGKTPLIFTYSSNQPDANNGVTEADWALRAAESGIGVSDLKSLFGGSAYKGPDGKLRMCTIAAIQKGYCATNFRLSIAQRVLLAERALAKNAICQWIGFDPSYHHGMARHLGAEGFSLHVLADCA